MKHALSRTPGSSREAPTGDVFDRTLPAGGEGNSGGPVPLGSSRCRDGPPARGEAKVSESSGGGELPKEIDREVVQRS